MDKTPSDVVELIIAVDLNPSNPEEPINVSNVDVRGKGEGGDNGGDWKSLCMKLLGTSDISFEEASKMAGDKGEPAEEKDPFSMHRSSKPMMEKDPFAKDDEEEEE